MSIPVIDTLKELGDFPVAEAASISVGSKRLDAVLDEKATNASVDAVKSDVTGLQNNKVDKASGKGLSTNDYTDAEKAKVSNAASEISKLNGYFTIV